jgi:hypothetical protein
MAVKIFAPQNIWVTRDGTKAHIGRYLPPTGDKTWDFARRVAGRGDEVTVGQLAAWGLTVEDVDGFVDDAPQSDAEAVLFQEWYTAEAQTVGEPTPFREWLAARNGGEA